MPGFDRTGPDGRGPMTGRGLGYCAGNVQPGTMPYGRGLGRGNRRMPWGRGMGNRFGATGIPRAVTMANA